MYDADGGLLGEAAYVWGRLDGLGGAVDRLGALLRDRVDDPSAGERRPAERRPE